MKTKMKAAMVFPTRESERAISGYSINLVNALRKNGVDVDEVNYTLGSPFTLLKKLPSLANYDIVHLQHEYNLLGGYGSPFYILFLFLGLMKKGKLITTMHTALSQKEKFIGSKIKTFLRKILYKTQNRIIYWASDKIFVHSDFFVPILEKEYGFSREKLVVLPQGIIEGIKKIPKSKAKKDLNLSGRVYLVIGNLTEDSGADIVIRHADKIGKTIVIVSNPTSVNKKQQGRLASYLDSMVKYSKSKNLSKYVRFDISPINDKMEKWWKYFFASDFVMLAYRGGIGSGIFTHAMATRTPVIASNIQFFKDISKKYSCLKIAEKEDDYSRIVGDSLKQKNYLKMLKECDRYARENGWNSIASKYRKVYEETLM